MLPPLLRQNRRAQFLLRQHPPARAARVLTSWSSRQGNVHSVGSQPTSLICSGVRWQGQKEGRKQEGPAGRPTGPARKVSASEADNAHAFDRGCLLVRKCACWCNEYISKFMAKILTSPNVLVYTYPSVRVLIRSWPHKFVSHPSVQLLRTDRPTDRPAFVDSCERVRTRARASKAAPCCCCCMRSFAGCERASERARLLLLSSSCTPDGRRSERLDHVRIHVYPHRIRDRVYVCGQHRRSSIRTLQILESSEQW